MKLTKFPPGWDERRVRDVLEHYEQQTEEEASNEDEPHPGVKGRSLVIQRLTDPAMRQWLQRDVFQRCP